MLAVLLALFAVSAFNAFPQAIDGNIVGTLRDPMALGVPKAKIVATNKDTNVKYETSSDASGEYRLNDVPVGRYDVTATADGFAPSTTADVVVDLNLTVSVNTLLQVGTVSSEVNIV